MKAWRVEVFECEGGAEASFLDHVKAFDTKEEALKYKIRINEDIDPASWYMYATGPFPRIMDNFQ